VNLLTGAIARTPARRNAVGSLVIQASQRLARIGTIIGAAAVLAPDRFAALAIALALTDIVRSALLAFDVSAVRLMAASDGRPRIMGTHLWAKVAVGVVGSVLILAFGIAAFDLATTQLILVLSVGTTPAGVAGLLLVRRQVDFQLGAAAARMAFASALGAGLALAAAWTTGDPLAVAAGLTVGDVVGLALLSSVLTAMARPTVREIGQTIRAAWTLLVMQIAYIGQFRAGTVILGVFGLVVAVGEYTVAARVAEGLVIGAAALTSSSYPLMGDAASRGDNAGLGATAAWTFRVSVWSATVIVALLAVSCPVWLAVVFPRYPGAAAVFPLVGLTVILYFASSQTSALLNASHRDRAAAGSAIVGVALAALGSWWLVAVGAVGAALARLGGDVARVAIESAATAPVAVVLARTMTRTWLELSPLLAGIALFAVAGWSIATVAYALAALGASVGWRLLQRGGFWTP
jgi:O-antigen/teichoic acid export membrane protein